MKSIKKIMEKSKSPAPEQLEAETQKVTVGEEQTDPKMQIISETQIIINELQQIRSILYYLADELKAAL